MEALDPLAVGIVAVVVLLVAGGVAGLVARGRGGAPPARDEARAAPTTERDAAEPAPAEEEGAQAAPDAAPEHEQRQEGAPSAPAAPAAEPAPAPEPLTPMERFRARLGRSRAGLGSGLLALFRRGLDEAAFEELEERLISADVGVEATMAILEGLRERVRAEGVTDPEQALALLKEILRLELGVADRTLARREDGTTTWLITGVNGTGKTTSIGKLAARHAREGESVVLAAADTFRAAAIEQLSSWGERAGARVVKQAEGADPAAVAYDGWQAASAADADLLLVDTAGRLQSKRALMEELSKVKRVLEKGAGHTDEVLLVLDATTGQNGISQAQAFQEAVDVSGVILTKLDGTARGGIVIAIQRQLGIPVKLVGLGETVDDLADFDVDAFVEALFADVAQDVELGGEEPADDER